MKPKTFSIRGSLIDIAVFSTAINLLVLATPMYLLQVYDRVLASSSVDTLIFLTILVVAALVVLGFLEAVRSVYATRIANRMDFAFSGKALANAISNAGTRGADTAPLRDLAVVRNFITSRLAFLVFDLPFAPVFIGIMYFLHPSLFWITAGGAVLLVILALLTQWATARVSRSIQAEEVNSQLGAQTLIGSSETLRALGMVGNVIGRWEEGQTSLVSGNDRRSQVVAIMGAISRAVRMCLQIAILGVGAWLVLNREMSAGVIFASSLISGRGLQPIDQVIGSWKQIVDSFAAWKRLEKAVASVPAADEGMKEVKPTGAISVEKLIYRAVGQQPGAEPVLKGLSFVVPAGRSMAITGLSGAGKSTLLRIIAGAIEPQAGTVRFDGVDIRNINAALRGAQVGYLEQRTELLPGTVGQNIARFDPDADEASIREAARLARIDHVIEALPEAYNTVLGPGKTVLSGGRMQQVALARALYRDPPILLLDEPNTALDRDGQESFFRALADARSRGRTIVIVTQRDDILPHVDALMIMKNGAIVEYGPRDEIVAKLANRAAPVKPAAAPAEAKPVPQQAAQRSNVSPFADFGAGLRPVAKNKGNAS